MAARRVLRSVNLFLRGIKEFESPCANNTLPPISSFFHHSAPSLPVRDFLSMFKPSSVSLTAFPSISPLSRHFSSVGQPSSISLLPLNGLSDRPGSTKKKRRLGRGIGSSKGKTAGRGHKGQKARSGRNPRIGFEGGQTPIRITLPKRGFHNPFRMEFQTVNLNTIADKIKSGDIDPSKVITMKTLKDARAVGKAMRHGVKLLGRGSSELNVPINIEVSRVSNGAKEAIESIGGTVTRVHYNKLGLRALLKPEWFVKKGRLLPRPARPPPRLLSKIDAVGTLPAPNSIYANQS